MATARKVVHRHGMLFVFPDIPAGMCMYEFGEKRLFNIGNNFIKSLIDISMKPKVNNNDL